MAVFRCSNSGGSSDSNSGGSSNDKGSNDNNNNDNGDKGPKGPSKEDTKDLTSDDPNVEPNIPKTPEVYSWLLYCIQCESK